MPVREVGRGQVPWFHVLITGVLHLADKAVEAGEKEGASRGAGRPAKSGCSYNGRKGVENRGQLAAGSRLKLEEGAGGGYVPAPRLATRLRG